MATLKDVAKDAGVSIATVSCCLSGSRYVKPETRTKIMDSIEKLKYIPNASARDLRSTSTNRIVWYLQTLTIFITLKFLRESLPACSEKAIRSTLPFPTACRILNGKKSKISSARTFPD